MPTTVPDFPLWRHVAKHGVPLAALCACAMTVVPARAAGADVDFIGTLVYGSLGSLVPVPGVEELWRGSQPVQTRLLLGWPVQVACLHGHFLSPECGHRLVVAPELVVADDVRVRGRVGYRFVPGGPFLGIGASADVDEGLAASPELGWRLREEGSSAHFIPHLVARADVPLFRLRTRGWATSLTLGWTLW